MVLVVLEKGLFRQTPTGRERGEESPPLIFGELGGTIITERNIPIVTVHVVITDTSEYRGNTGLIGIVVRVIVILVLDRLIRSRQTQVIIGIFPSDLAGLEGIRLVRNAYHGTYVVYILERTVEIQQKLCTQRITLFVVILCQCVGVHVKHRILQIG